MEKGELLYEGKAKKVFLTSDPETLIVRYKDDATALNGLKRGTIRGKGSINNRMSNRLMQRLEREGVPTHFVRELSGQCSKFSVNATSAMKSEISRFSEPEAATSLNPQNAAPAARGGLALTGCRGKC